MFFFFFFFFATISFFIDNSPYVCTENDVQKSAIAKSSEDESSSIDDSEEENSLGKVVTKAGKEIYRKSAGNVKRSKDEAKADAEVENEFGYTDGTLFSIFYRISTVFLTRLNIDLLKFTEKIKKRYGHLGSVIRVRFSRTNNSIGIALAGHRNRHEMGCFIAGLNPKGAASSKNLKVGDEILEVISFDI